MATMGNLEDTDIDIAIDDQDQSERSARELANRLRLVAAADPERARELVDQLTDGLNRVTSGTFREHLDGAAR